MLIQLIQSSSSSYNTNLLFRSKVVLGWQPVIPFWNDNKCDPFVVTVNESRLGWWSMWSLWDDRLWCHSMYPFWIDSQWKLLIMTANETILGWQPLRPFWDDKFVNPIWNDIQWGNFGMIVKKKPVWDYIPLASLGWQSMGPFEVAIKETLFYDDSQWIVFGMTVNETPLGWQSMNPIWDDN